MEHILVLNHHYILLSHLLAKDDETSVLMAVDHEGQKTVSLASAEGVPAPADQTSSMGTSTALALQATSDEMLYEKIVELLKSPLVATIAPYQ